MRRVFLERMPVSSWRLVMLNSALLDECDRRMRSQGKARSTRKTYRKHLESLLRWAKWKYGNWQHPRDIGRDGVQRWLSDLANVKNVSPTTQNCALQAALYLFREVLKTPLEGVDAMRARRPQRLPVVLCRTCGRFLLGCRAAI